MLVQKLPLEDDEFISEPVYLASVYGLEELLTPEDFEQPAQYYLVLEGLGAVPRGHRKVEFEVAANGELVNVSEASWPAVGNATVTGVFLFDKDGLLLMNGNISKAKTVMNGDTFKFTSGSISVKLS